MAAKKKAAKSSGIDLSKEVTVKQSVGALLGLFALVSVLSGVFFWFFTANARHEMTVEHAPRIDALEDSNAEYQSIWADAVDQRKRDIEEAFDVCRDAGKCK